MGHRDVEGRSRYRSAAAARGRDQPGRWGPGRAVPADRPPRVPAGPPGRDGCTAGAQRRCGVRAAGWCRAVRGLLRAAGADVPGDRAEHRLPGVPRGAAAGVPAHRGVVQEL